MSYFNGERIEDFAEGDLRAGEKEPFVGERMYERGFDAGVASTQEERQEERIKYYEDGAKSERQFILNILDGIDKADSEMLEKHLQPVGGGTKAIRFALQNRIIKEK